MLLYDVVIVGAGPAGLACAQTIASQGMNTLVLERKAVIGTKICAGGITWNGLITKLKDVSERSFATQHIYSKKQSFTVSEKNPIIATVNRETLGTLMLENARTEGAEVMANKQVTSISNNTLTILDKITGNREEIGYQILVGADGSSSTVRKHLKLPIDDFGIGINYMIEGQFDKMEWHLNSSLFGSGYSWIFPHKSQASIGAYTDAKSISARKLKQSLDTWADTRNIALPSSELSAERINYDYKGYRFGNTYLIGDAAGFASALTGEGIYPAILSGEAVGREIYTKTANSAGEELKNLLKNHNIHRRMAKIVRKHPAVSTCLSELICYGLKKNIIDFRAAEMAH